MKAVAQRFLFDHLKLMEKRIQFLVGARVVDRQKMASASEKIDKLCRKISGWNSVDELRRLREQSRQCMSLTLPLSSSGL